MKGGWREKCLGDICHVIGGGTPSKAKAEYFNGEIPWATVRDMRRELITSTEYKITNAAVKNSSTNIIRGGNVVIATRVGLGKVCLLGQDTAINQDLRGIVPIDAKVIDVRFLFLWFVSIAEVIVAEGTGATVQGVKLPFIKSLKIPLPPFQEQHRIVAILDEAFERIDTAKANAEKNLNNARELFESYLQSAFSQTGNGWRLRKLVEIATTFGRGKSRHRPRGDVRLLGGAYPLIQTGEVANSNHYITEYSQTYSELGLAQSKLWPKGTICIAIVGANVAETAILDFDACFPDSVIGIVVNEKLADNEYVEFVLQSFKSVLKERGKGTARDNINMGTFENQKFPFPDVNVQKKIVSKINAIANETQHLESLYQQKITSLDVLKKSLLNKAFSGAL